MARKRSRRRTANPAPLLLVALVIAAIVGWAIYPRGHRPQTAPHRSVALVTASPSPAPIVAATTSAPPSPAASPALSPSASPAAPASPAAGNAQVAIIIDDCGQWLDTERALIGLPIPITLSVLPHVHYTAQIAQEAAGAGKGVMLHIPMEPLSHAYPGPGEIKDAMTDEQVRQQTEDDVAQVPLAKGANNHEGSEASADDRVMKDVVAVLKAHDLFFVDSRTNARSVGQAVAQDDGVPSAKRDVFLDNQASVAYTESMLERAVEVAKRNGSAIAIGHPKPTTLAAIRDLYPKMQAEGVTFVLAQSLVR
ncbi:MAG TPA: divergent polysaccharide deacetylase family protein [Candidatus Baltobacteraceae bacterium]|nr:divergent polysaccharide deacetylase family protein [Candidatus Baltobacteraceae bacterium]